MAVPTDFALLGTDEPGGPTLGKRWRNGRQDRYARVALIARPDRFAYHKPVRRRNQVGLTCRIHVVVEHHLMKQIGAQRMRVIGGIVRPAFVMVMGMVFSRWLYRSYRCYEHLANSVRLRRDEGGSWLSSFARGFLRMRKRRRRAKHSNAQPSDDNKTAHYTSTHPCPY